MNAPLPSGRGPLAGIRVVDLSHFESGPSCTQLLAFLGAEVIKVERPDTGEHGRAASADTPGLDSYYFLVLNANKRSITLNLQTAEGVDILYDLARRSDVFVQNFAPGTAARLGVDYDAITAVNNMIVYASISGFGRGTPYENFASFDPIAQAAGGSVSLTGDPDGPPMRPGPTFADSGAGLLAAIGILASLLDRQRGGPGREVDVALQDAIINFCRVGFASQLMYGTKGPRAGNGLSVPSEPAGLYACKPEGDDSYCYIYTGRGAVGDRKWAALLRTIGREDLLDDPRCSTADARIRNAGFVRETIEAWTRHRSKTEVMEILGAAGVPVAPVLDTVEISEDPGLRARGTMVEVEHPARGRYVMPGVPLHLSGYEPVVRAAPVLGEANDYVFGELLGISPERRQQLRERRVI